MSYLDHFKSIKAFVFDVDGVLTDGKVTLLPDGGQMRTMHSKDGYALHMAIKQGFQVAIITGGNSEQVRSRMQQLGIYNLYMACSHKDEAMEDFLMIHNIDSEHVMYMGDDVPDIAALRMVGLPACPADAGYEVKSISKFISKRRGGDGCVRDIIEQVMKTQGKWYEHDKNSDNLAEFTW